MQNLEISSFVFHRNQSVIPVLKDKRTNRAKYDAIVIFG